ncbi:MAG: endonuclease/exonuclease/phosphatase family protein [Anaerolineae bacterium]|nr:endonuclease/exonuclease/phosphatase family protein [Anaerolineae bacterium]
MAVWKRGLKSASWVVSMLCLLYGGLTAAYVFARLIIGERWSLVELANSLMPNPLLPLFIAVPILLLLRRWRWSLIYAPALLVFTVQYSPLLLPNVSDAPVTSPHVRVLTYNLGSMVADAGHTAEVIRSADAHIVALQELLLPVAERLVADLSDLYPYRALHPNDSYAQGVGLLSKYPITDDRYLDQIVLGGQQTRIALAADTTITVLNVHPVAPAARLFGIESTLRSQEISYALDLAAQVTEPLLLVGDFNTTDQTEVYARIAARYGDAFRAGGTGFGASFPNFTRFAPRLRWLPPIIRIDYVFYDVHWEAVRAYTLGDHGGSDHYPVLAELAFTGGQAVARSGD